MEGFNEQIVKRAKKPKNLIIKIISVLLLFAVPAICVLLALALKIPYIIYLGFFLFLGGIYAVWYVFTSQKVEFEYSVVGGDLEISKVIALRKRKKICKVKISEIEQLEQGENSIDGMRFSKSFYAARDIDASDENYYAVFNSTAYGKSLLVFNPNEQILNGMKSHLNRTIVVKLFYQRNVG